MICTLCNAKADDIKLPEDWVKYYLHGYIGRKYKRPIGGMARPALIFCPDCRKMLTDDTIAKLFILFIKQFKDKKVNFNTFFKEKENKLLNNTGRN